MIVDVLRRLKCLFRHDYLRGRFFNANIQGIELGERCAVCGKTRMDK